MGITFMLHLLFFYRTGQGNQRLFSVYVIMGLSQEIDILIVYIASTNHNKRWSAWKTLIFLIEKSYRLIPLKHQQKKYFQNDIFFRKIIPSS